MNKAPEVSDDKIYPVRQFWNRHVVSKKLWDEEEWLVDYLLESVEKTVEKHLSQSLQYNNCRLLFL